MIYIRSTSEIEKIQESNRINYETLLNLGKYIKPGITTLELDTIAEDYIRSQGGKPAFKGYRGFPSTLCTSINEQVVHGIPSKRKLLDGDIIGIDVGVEKDGYFGDAAFTYSVGSIDEKIEKLMNTTREALYLGIAKAVPGNRLSDIGNTIQTHVENNGFSVVRVLVGHGIGSNLHEEPEIPNFGVAGRGPVIKPGMVFAIEPMVNMGIFKVKTLDDNWTVVTHDNKVSAHYEHSIVIKEDGPYIMADIKDKGEIEFYGKRKSN